MRRMLQVAVEKERILTNPCERVQTPRVPHREMVSLNWPDAVELAEARGERYWAFIYLAVDSGMRWSELVGLRRARLDVRSRKVRVRLQTGEWLRKEPKTGSSIRSITISPFTAELLAGHLEAFANPGVDGLVFPNKAGNPLISSSWWNNNFAPALRKTGLSCRFHDLRWSTPPSDRVRPGEPVPSVRGRYRAALAGRRLGDLRWGPPKPGGRAAPAIARPTGRGVGRRR
jgi:integrase